MTRWAPDARRRLQEAALELFATQGYESTTAAQIAERAGLNRATFFRHFADKREILFGGEDELPTLLSNAIRAAPPDADLPACLLAALRAADAQLTPEQRPLVVQRRRIADESAEVQERGLLKLARTTASVAAALGDRGVDELTARLGAEVLILAFGAGLRAWAATDDSDDSGAPADPGHSDGADRVDRADAPFSAYAASALAAVLDSAGRLRAASGQECPAHLQS
jgi:AcrR family transcriptional regulator